MRRRLRVALLLGVAVATSAALLAEETGKLVTDPEQLVRMGFAADARNVYMVESATRLRPFAKAEFGITDLGYAFVLGNQHSPRHSSTYQAWNGFGDIFVVSGDLHYDAQLDMPDGASIEILEWTGFDQSPVGFTFSLLRGCYASAGPPTITILFSEDIDIDGGTGEFLLSFPPDAPVTVDNRNCAYVARTHFEEASSVLRLRRFRVGWRRQVSPAPAVATFPNDVPTTHPYFRFIEALADSGITAGCAPQSFCPNSPITRGQMAVFLAAALGLHWP